MLLIEAQHGYLREERYGSSIFSSHESDLCLASGLLGHCFFALKGDDLPTQPRVLFGGSFEFAFHVPLRSIRLF